MNFIRNDDGSIDKVSVVLLSIVAFFVIFLIGFLIYVVVDMVYVEPVADNSANKHCKNLDFDQYKSYSRVGLWSKIPIGIRCEYAEKFTDLGVRTSSSI